MGRGPAQLGTRSSPHTRPHLSLTSRLQADSTGQLNTILTFPDIIEPPVPSQLSGIPMTLLRKAIAILAKTSRAQTISVADGEGVRFLQGNTSR